MYGKRLSEVPRRFDPRKRRFELKGHEKSSNSTYTEPPCQPPEWRLDSGVTRTFVPTSQREGICR